MQITCPNCATSYQVAEAALGATGRKVRCARCGTQWHARPAPPPDIDELMAEAEWEAIEEEARKAPAEPPIPPAPAPAPAPPAAAAKPASSDWTDALDEGAKRASKAGSLPDDEFGAPPRARQDEIGAEADDDAEAAAAMTDAAAEGATGSNVVPFPGNAEQAAEAPEAAAATIEAEPAGFRPRPTPKSKQKRKPTRAGPSPMMRRIMSALVIGVAIALVGVTLGGAFFARETVVRAFPDLASLYALVGLEVNLRGLEFSDVTTQRELDGSTPILAVQGSVMNVTREPQAVPTLRFALKSSVGREVYAWTMQPPKAMLDGGESLSFKSRLPTPPESAAEVEVRFTDAARP